MPHTDVLTWLVIANEKVMLWIGQFWWPCWTGIFFVGTLISMAPLKMHHEHHFLQIVFVYIRRTILLASFSLLCLPLVLGYFFNFALVDQQSATEPFWNWFILLAKRRAWLLIPASMFGWTFRFLFHRYVETFFSKALRHLRKSQTTEMASDIRHEQRRFAAKDFSPSHYYRRGHLLVGLDTTDSPLYIPENIWNDTHMQVIGPTRYGKGVLLGCLMDQLIRQRRAVIYIDPKSDTFAPHIMHQACIEAGRPFHYVALHDEGVGAWAPFAGGTERDALERIEVAFGLEFTGDPGTDFHKSQERQALEKAFRQTREISGLTALLAETDAHRIKAELNRWKYVRSLCPPPGFGLSLAEAIRENAVIYLQGKITDSVVKTATKIFVIEAVQEAMRLTHERSMPLTLLIDEVRFLASKQLADSLATAAGFGVNIVTAYQSTKDLLTPDDRSINGESILQSINVNSQIKAVYGGADYATAEWVAEWSGTVQKEVAKFERTDIRLAGGEIWQNQRTIGTEEEALVPTNVVLALPPRVCAFIQPRQLATICHTAFVPVRDREILYRWLEKTRNAEIESRASALSNTASSTVTTTLQTRKKGRHLARRLRQRRARSTVKVGKADAVNPQI